MPIILTTPAGSTLADATRAGMNATLAALPSNTLSAMLASATGLIQRHCKRDFFQTDYAEYYDGGGVPNQLLALRQFPVAAVTRVATDPQTVLTVSNLATSTNQRATVDTLATGLRLYRMASGVASTVDLAYQTYPTLQSMANAVAGLGNGWAASVAAGYTLHPSADLRPMQGAVDARSGAASLEMYLEDIPSWRSVGAGGFAGVWNSDVGWRLEPATGQLWGYFPTGIQNIRVDYTAGFAVIPDAVQEACVLLAQDLYQGELANRALTSEGLGPYRVAYAGDQQAMSKAVRNLLAPYVAHDGLVGW